MKVFTNDTNLLTERSELVGTTHIPQWTEAFSNKLAVESGAKPTLEQWDLYCRRREYLLPTMNRGQVVRVAYLNDAHTEHQPSLWIDIVHKGVKVELRAPHNIFMGVSQPHSVLVGSVLGLLVLKPSSSWWRCSEPSRSASSAVGAVFANVQTPRCSRSSDGWWPLCVREQV